MNEKGFTLIELLITIALISVVTTIAVISITNISQSAKIRNENIFIGRLSDVIDEYITIYNSNYDYSYYKNETKETNEVTISKTDNINLSKLVETGLIKSPITNPSNQKDCLDDSPNFVIYKDTDYVFCFATTLPCLERNDKMITNCNFEVE